MRLMRQIGLAFIHVGVGLVAASAVHEDLSWKAATIRGSDAMVALVQELAGCYMQAHPGSNISLTGGGSGIASLTPSGILKARSLCLSNGFWAQKASRSVAV